jgi:diguanylate cyclase
VNALLNHEDIDLAIASGQFVLHFQPVVDLPDGRVRGTEALIRWQHPVGGLLPPDDFMPALAQTAAVVSITRWVLDTACAAVVRWPGWTIGVNITARDLAREEFVTDVLEALDTAGASPERLVLELTETALVQDLPRAAAILGELRGRGVGVALDDFGTGYSSILYLRKLPITSIKIDRMFIAGVARDGDDRAIVASLLTLARNVGLVAIAEGVETEAQADMLHSLGCPMAQGYLWARPQPLDATDTVHRDGLASSPRRRKRGRSVRVQHFDERVVRRVLEMVAQGASLHTIAAALNASGERTSRGSRWHANSVAHIIDGSDMPPSR